MDLTKEETVGSEYIVIKSLGEGVQVIGLTRGVETKSHHIEFMLEGEIVIAQFTGKTSAIKIRGNAEVYTKFGKIDSYTK